MHQFAISAEPGGLDRPASGLPDSAPQGSVVSRGVEAMRGLFRVYRGMSGLDAYERYCAHHALEHPGHAPMSEAEFWRASWENDSKNPKARCC